ncbi:MAG: 50S ribosomal protein L32 [Intestinibacter sp.]
MAVPQRRVSKTRRHKRRTHDKLTGPSVVVCPECGEYKLSHKYANIAGHNGQSVIKTAPYLRLFYE